MKIGPLYRVSSEGVTKNLESWLIVLPLHDNEGKAFPQAAIDGILDSIALTFPGLTAINCTGLWRSQGKTYRDRNLQVVVDVVPNEDNASADFFSKLKAKLAAELSQEKIYVTKQVDKHELLTFDEFFAELGLSPAQFTSMEAMLEAAGTIASNFEFVRTRMGYRTISLRRDQGRIRWERELAGIRLVSVLDDPFPAGLTVVAADDIDGLASALDSGSCAIFGDYEFQSFCLMDQPFEPVVRSSFRDSDAYPGHPYSDLHGGEPISVADYLERLVSAIAVNLVVLRDYGFTPEEITITVGKDGSLQQTNSPLGNVVMYLPGHLPEKSFQDEVLRGVREFCSQLDAGTYNKYALQKAKAGNGYIVKRAQLKYQLAP